MPADKTRPVLVTGGTGKTGAAVLAALAARGVRARALVRKETDRDRLQPIADPVVADFDDAGSLVAALAGVGSAYLVTPSSERAEEQQLRFAELALGAGVRRLVVLSQLGADEESPVRFLRYHAVVERHVRELGLDYTFLRPNLYFQGLLDLAPLIAAQDRFFAAIGDAKVSAVDVRDIGDVAAAALTESRHERRTYTLTGPAAITHHEMAAALTSAVGRQISFVDVSPEEFAAGLAGVLPPWQVEGMLEDYAHYRRGEAAAVSPDVAEVTGHPARDVAEFARDHAPAFRPPAEP
ncbi:MAG: NAD(P)-dependent oxidoreductase [Actinobacteria bacterium 13_2_20CM_2_72_6]|nr:MAG: NAD(P)-dependent oxidoreductase [Actinobacteria bacterium 13_2_20CM_2_72_6]